MWSDIFGQRDGGNRAQRRAADKEYRRMMRQNQRAQESKKRAQQARSNPKKED